MEIRFKDKQKSYDFKLTDFGLSYKSQFVDYNIGSTKCNKPFFDILVGEINRELKTRSISSNPNKTFLVKKDGKALNIVKDTSLGYYLFNLDKKISHLRLKEKLHCQK
jgi:hypothetical protein